MEQIEPSSSSLYIYKASAGAGKTFTLTIEYILVLLLHPGEQEYAKTLAVTFTNKATAEMKNRILQQLYGIGHGLKESKGYLDEIKKRLKNIKHPMEEEEIRKRCKDALSRILHDYGRFRVETIDSFFQSILRDLARELGLPPNLQVELDNEKVITLAVDRIIDKLQDNTQLQQWLLNYVNEQLEENDSWNVTKSLKEFAKCLFMEILQGRTEEEREWLNDEQRIKDFQSKMHAIEKKCREDNLKKAQSLLKKLEEGPINPNMIYRYNDIVNAINGMRDIKYNPQKPSKTYQNVLADPSCLLKKEFKNDASFLEFANEIAKEMQEMHSSYIENQKLINSTRLARNRTNPLRLLGEIERAVNEINEENNQFSLSKTPTLLASLIEGNDAPFVFEKAGTTFRNVLIDEFQDTSSLQWKNFKVLLLENQASGGSNLLVGDVKQSIYRWRNGDWSILSGIEDELKNMSPTSIPLRTNFRSRGKIIDFNNMLFPKIAQIMDDAGQDERFKIKDIYADVTQEKHKEPDKGYVYIHLGKKEGNSKIENYEEDMVEDMIVHIRQLQAKGQALKKMAILLRKKEGKAKQLITLFHQKAKDIPLVSDEAFLLQASKTIQILITALRVLVDAEGEDQMSRYFLAMSYHKDVLHSPLPSDELFSPSPESRFPDFLQQREELVQMPLYLLCEKLFRLFSLEKIESQEPYIYTFYDELQKYIKDNPSDIQSFLDYWDEKMYKTPIPSGEVEGIRILTIHKSKGLEFDTVLVPYTDWFVERDIQGDELWCRAKEKPFNELGILPITPGAKMRTSIFAPQMIEEHLQKRVDAINMLYVAFTRATCNLLIWGIASSNAFSANSNSIAGDLLLTALEEKNMKQEGKYLTWEDGEIYVPDSPQEHETDSCPNRLVPNEEKLRVNIVSLPPRIDFQQSNQSQQFLKNLEEENDTQSYLELGNILHYVLSKIRYLDDVPRILKQCQTQGLITDEKTRDNILQRIQYGMQNPIIQEWFSKDKQIYNECSIAFIDQETGQPTVKRPDRVVMTEQKVIVIDFKFGHPHPKYNEQVANYMQLIQCMYPKKKVEGWLWYVYSGQTCPISIQKNDGK